MNDELKARKAAKKEQKRAERDRAALLRGSQLARLHSRQVIDERRLKAGLLLRELYVTAMSSVRAVDLTGTRVDGGGGGDAAAVAMINAQKELNRILDKSGMGHDAAGIVIKVACCDESLQSAALLVEENAAALAEGKAGRYAQHVASFMLRRGLGAVADLLMRPYKPWRGGTMQHVKRVGGAQGRSKVYISK